VGTGGARGLGTSFGGGDREKKASASKEIASLEISGSGEKRAGGGDGEKRAQRLSNAARRRRSKKTAKGKKKDTLMKE